MDAGSLSIGARASTPIRWLPRGAVVVLACAGGALLVGGSLLPWLSLYAGIDTINGVAGMNGRVLLGAGIVSVIAGLSYAWRPSQLLRYALAALGFVTSGFAAWVLSQLLGSYQELQGDAFVVASLGTGAFLAFGGALMVLGTLFVPQPVRIDQGRRAPATAIAATADGRNVLLTGVVAFLVSAAMIHLAVVGPHLQESALYAAFFVIAAVAQLAAAMSLTITQRRWWLLTIAIGNALVIAVWALTRTVGLPIGPTPGIAESVSLPDVLATVAEVAIVALSLALALSRRRLTTRRWVVAAAAIALGLAAAVSTAVAIIGVQAGGG